MIICDVTVDFKHDLTPEELEQQKQTEDVYKHVIKDQKDIIQQLETAVNMPIIGSELVT